MSGSSGSDPVHKISRSDPDSALDHVAMLIMVSGLDHGDELSVLDGSIFFKIDRTIRVF